MSTTTRQLSKIAKISEQTARNWSREYGELLSSAARGEAGPRLFSDQDVQVFCSIATLRRDDVPPADVIKRLRHGDVYIAATDHNTPQQDAPSPTEAPQATQTTSLVYLDLRRQIAALRHAQQAQVRRALWSHGVAFYLGMLTMGVLFYAVWWLVNGG